MLARAAGRYSGRAVGAMLRLRERLTSAARESELTELHAELQQGMAQLAAIREAGTFY